jgi:hypothetical protein
LRQNSLWASLVHFVSPPTARGASDFRTAVLVARLTPSAKLLHRMLTAQQNAVHYGASSMFAVPHRTRREHGFSHRRGGRSSTTTG